MDSRYFSTADLLTLLVGLALAFVLGVLVGTVLLRLSLRWIEGIRAGFLRCCGTLLIGAAVGAVAQSVLMTAVTVVALVFGIAIHSGPGLAVSVVASITGFVLSALGLAFAVQWLVSRPDGSRLPFVRALGVASAALVMGAAIYAAVVAALLFGLGGVPGVSR